MSIVFFNIYYSVSTIFLSLTLISYCDGDIRAVKDDYVGVVYSPYSKYREGPNLTFPAWNSYSQAEVGTELEIVSTKFRNISTIGTGAYSLNTTWKIGNAIGFTGIEAAKLNKKLSKLAVSVNIGVWDYESIDNAIPTAFDIAEDSNEIYPGTVWGITCHHIQDPEEALHVDSQINKAKNISAVRNIPISLGIRLNFCENLRNSGNNDTMQIILRKLDYIICIKNPLSEEAGEITPRKLSNAINHMKDSIMEIKKEVASINSKLQVILETGWPSTGISYNNLPTSTKLMSEYWTGISNWASANAVPVYLSAAFDEPWKSGETKDGNAPNGPCGAEGHYGWWRRLTNKATSGNSYIEKIYEPEVTLCPPVVSIKGGARPTPAAMKKGSPVEPMKGATNTGVKERAAIGIILFLFANTIFSIYKMR